MRILELSQLGKAIDELRGAETLTGFAKRLGVSRQVLSYYISGINQPNPKVLRKLGYRLVYLKVEKKKAAR